MKYTVKQLADLASISVRTLHYYDEIGLLKPSHVADNGYRYYQQPELLKLQQILFFRELDFPLADITKMVNASNFEALTALLDQRKLLKLKQDRLTDLLTTIDRTITTLKGGENMNNNDLFGSFTTDQIDQYKEEAKQRWGDTQAYQQSVERTTHWTKADYDKVAKEGAAFTQKIADAMVAGLAVTSPEVQELIDQHYNAVRTFYEPNYEMYKGLGQMYVDDPRFKAYYEECAQGLAVFMRDAMLVYVEKNT
jgi:DNA-binding transcriptional MerR regulator